MAVLSSILPGVRAVRAPLAAGFVLLMALWLAVEPAVPTSHTTGIAHSLYRLKGTFSTVGAAGLVSFVAYLTGSLYVVATSAVASSRRKWLMKPQPQTLMSLPVTAWEAAAQGVVQALRYSAIEGEEADSNVGYYLSGADRRPDDSVVAEATDHQLQDRVPTAQLRGRLLDSVTRATTNAVDEAQLRVDEARLSGRQMLLVYSAARGLSSEWDSLPLSVIGDPLYAEIDRFQSEAEFRAALTGPIAALEVVVLARSGASWWVWPLGIAGIVAVMLALSLASLHARDQANTAIANGIFAGKIKPLALQPEQVRRWYDELRHIERAENVSAPR